MIKVESTELEPKKWRTCYKMEQILFQLVLFYLEL